MASIFGAAGAQLLQILTPQAAKATGYKGTPAVGTGIMPFVDWATKQGLVTPETLKVVIPTMPGVFGNFPQDTTTEHAVDGLMVGLFAVLALSFFYVFGRNLQRGHNFFFTFGTAWFCLFKVIGYACRIAWSKDVTKIKLAIASVVFIQVGQLVLLAMNQILAHRIFTWRHPETGNSWWMCSFLNSLYFYIFPVIVMAILGQALPFIYFMDAHHYKMCQQVTQAGGVLNLVYAILPLGLLFLAFAFRPGQLTAEPWKRKHSDEELLPPVYQASWIHSANPFYYVRKGSQHVIYKDEPAAKAIRIIPSREPPANGRHESHHEPMHPDSPRFSVAVLIVLTTTLIFTMNTAFRCASTFQTGPIGNPPHHWVFHDYVQWIFYGATEVIALVLYLLGRVDLRFYIPDMAKSAKKNPRPYNGSDFNEPKPDLDVEYTTPASSHR